MRAGWWVLLAFLVMGIALETRHGFKVGWYLDVASWTRRHIWTLLALVNLPFGATARQLPPGSDPGRQRASDCLLAAMVLLPYGFLLGGCSRIGEIRGSACCSYRWGRCSWRRASSSSPGTGLAEEVAKEDTKENSSRLVESYAWP